MEYNQIKKDLPKLKQIAIIRQKNKELQESECLNFNIFKILNVLENGTSSLICDLLNPRKYPALSDSFLRIFIELLREKIGNNDVLETFQTNNAKISTEVSFKMTDVKSKCGECKEKCNDGRIDILINDKQDRGVIIENKFNYAENQKNQLCRYDKYGQKHFPKGYVTLYLSRYELNDNDKEEVREESAKEVKFFNISFRNFITEWLEKCLVQTVNYPLIRETINQFIYYMKSKTGQSMSKEEVKEIAKLIVKDDLVETTCYLASNINELVSSIFKEWKKELDKKELGTNSFIVLDDKGHYRVGVILQQKFCATLQFNLKNRKLSVGFTTLYHSYQPEDKARENNYDKNLEKLLIDGLSKIIPDTPLDKLSEKWYCSKYTTFKDGFKNLVKLKETIPSNK
ncbi:MAG: PD-(D/E)XK nuclease family protein [Bacteroidales bacterium]|jgi:hypothetical protein|nr:PD-(D/E)XK nuclease family protein [Bacteroidales bacterium]